MNKRQFAESVLRLAEYERRINTILDALGNNCCNLLADMELEIGRLLLDELDPNMDDEFYEEFWDNLLGYNMEDWEDYYQDVKEERFERLREED